jgi:hypothetical protein
MLISEKTKKIVGKKFINKIKNKIVQTYDIYNPINKKYEPYYLIDSGFYDNIAILSLIRRRVNIIISFFPATKEFTYSNIKSTNFEDFKLNFGNLALLFGRATSKNNMNFYDTMESHNNNFKIFKSYLWDELKQEVMNRYNQGLALYHILETNTLKNDYLGIEEYKIKILFIFSSNSHKWVEKLPIETQNLLDDNFTFPSILNMKYGPFLTSMLVQKSMWDIFSINDDININDFIN